MKHKLKAEDLALWEAITREIRPLASPLLPKVASFGNAKKKSGMSGSLTPEKKSDRPPQPSPAMALPELLHGRGLDRRAGRQLRKGSAPIDRTIDLHGMTQIEAHQALIRFLHKARAGNDRCVLVITGKGGPKGGILRSQVPRWLNEPDLRSFILAFDHAGPRHGGQGALYILLKRKR